MRIKLEEERRVAEKVREEEKKSEEVLLKVREVVGGDVKKIGDSNIVEKVKEAKQNFEGATA